MPGTLNFDMQRYQFQFVKLNFRPLLVSKGGKLIQIFSLMITVRSAKVPSKGELTEKKLTGGSKVLVIVREIAVFSF